MNLYTCVTRMHSGIRVLHTKCIDAQLMVAVEPVALVLMKGHQLVKGVK